MINDLLVDAGELPIAARDFGGPHRPVLLLHGAGGNLATLTALARALRPRHRVVAVDLRGHGRSGDGQFTWDAAVADLAAVAAHLDLDRPAVVGHSLGGMLAVRWGRAHPDSPGVVSLDGTPPPTRPDQVPGATADLPRLTAVFDAMAAAAGRPLDPAQVTALIESHRQLARDLGAPEKILVEGLRRNLTTRDGQTVLKPSHQTTAQLRALMTDFDMPTEYAAVRCPLLVVVATRDLPHQQPYSALYAAHRAWATDQVAAAASRSPRMRYLRLADASHAMIDEQPEQLATIIGGFLTAR